LKNGVGKAEICPHFSLSASPCNFSAFSAFPHIFLLLLLLLKSFKNFFLYKYTAAFAARKKKGNRYAVFG